MYLHCERCAHSRHATAACMCIAHAQKIISQQTHGRRNKALAIDSGAAIEKYRYRATPLSRSAATEQCLDGRSRHTDLGGQLVKRRLLPPTALAGVDQGHQLMQHLHPLVDS